MRDKVWVIAEIGCNHQGNFEIAKQMIEVAAEFSKVDIVKFQKRTPRELLTEEEYNRPHPYPENSFGKTYGEHREFLEFNIDQHKQLKEYAQQKGVIYACSVWDYTAAKEIVSLSPAYIKVPSASNLRFDMLSFLCDNYGGDIHLSLGMTTREEEEKIVKFFEDKKREKSLILYACTSGYPVPFEDIYLLEITRLKNKYGNIIKDVGFSGHHLGIAVDISAVTLGANWVERHFTLDRTWKGTDHAASLEPDGLRRLARDIRNVLKALREKPDGILEIEIPNRKKLKGYADE